MIPGELLSKRLLFFTGKGGVGKSTVAAATAVLAAAQGKRVLLVEVDAKGNLASLFEQEPVGFAPREVAPGVMAMTMDTEASLREYLKLNLRIPVAGRIGPVARVFDFVATAAPGVREILTVGKICWEVKEAIAGNADHDLVIVDSAATGHVVAQLGAAQSIRELVDVGPIRQQTQWMVELLSDPAVTAVNVVTTPEEMPVTETIELVERLRSDVATPLGCVVVNRVLPELFTRAEEATFEALCTPSARARLAEAAGPGINAVLDGARLAVGMRRSGAEHLQRLATSVDLPLLYVPYQFVRTQGLRVTHRVAEALGEELG